MIAFFYALKFHSEMPKNNEIREGKKQSIALTTSNGTTTVLTKVCKFCKQEKPISEFYKPTVCVCKRCICKKNSQKVLDKNLSKYPNLPNEQWKEAVGFNGDYLISNFGRVRSMVYGGHRGRILSPVVHKQGYLWVRLHGKCYLIHRLVGTAFIPNQLHKATINHIDGNKANNHVSNLEWATQSENNKHAFRTGLHTITDKQKISLTKGFKIPLCEIPKIREMYDTGTPMSQIGKMYGVDRIHIWRICNNKTRKTAKYESINVHHNGITRGDFVKLFNVNHISKNIYNGAVHRVLSIWNNEKGNIKISLINEQTGAVFTTCSTNCSFVLVKKLSEEKGIKV